MKELQVPYLPVLERAPPTNKRCIVQQQKGAIMVKSENSKIRVLIYNSSDSAIIATLRDLYYSPIFPMIRFFRFFRLSSDYTYFSYSPIITTIYRESPIFSDDTIFRSDYNDYLHNSPIFPIIRFFRLF